jgi:Protein of unknown function (DUF4435)
MVNRTSSGINNADLFHKNEYLVYVEGKDDINFWRIFFPDEIDGFHCKIKPVGGDNEIEKYLSLLINNNGHFAVAFDSNYKLFSNLTYDHPRMIETIKHSIENVMITSNTLSQIILVKSHQENYDISNVEGWLDHFNRSMHDLMIADYIIQIKNIGKPCLSDNCFRFLENQNTKQPLFDVEKIDDFIQKLELPEDVFNFYKEKLTQYKPNKHIQGHFLFSASLCFVNHEVNRLKKCKKKTHSSNEDLYATLIFACKSSISTEEELQIIQQKAKKVAEEVVKILS